MPGGSVDRFIGSDAEAIEVAHRVAARLAAHVPLRDSERKLPFAARAVSATLA
ncbi:hypothetical protein [Burkholderia seminalis]|uniref:hypothetical protein n=1 Tax=Burkholderia seminalis TaxID=488731 RepID=UPI0015883B66|nr:hypothetical protein [Burkholderia seminalis]